MGKLRNSLTPAIVLVLLVLAPVQAADAPGFLWESTSQVVMEGMPMKPPPRTSKMCAAREWNRPPPGGDPSCVSSNYSRTGNKVTWTVQCSGQMAMTGEGEITLEGDTYSGQINATANGMSLKILLTGKKIGTCDKPE